MIATLNIDVFLKAVANVANICANIDLISNFIKRILQNSFPGKIRKIRWKEATMEHIFLYSCKVSFPVDSFNIEHLVGNALVYLLSVLDYHNHNHYHLHNHYSCLTFTRHFKDYAFPVAQAHTPVKHIYKLYKS